MLANKTRELCTRIARARGESPLAAPEVRLVAASKGQGIERVKEAIDAGITHFGENRVQEAQEKWSSLKTAYPEIKLHLIGPLQTNKVKEAVEFFDYIETLDRPKLAQELIKEMEKQNKQPVVFIQINTGEEPQKSGIAPGEADVFIKDCKAQGLSVRGLMCVPPVGVPSAPHFALLRAIALRHGLTELSMGMSEDFETAVKMGATEVRLGRLLFGERN